MTQPDLVAKGAASVQHAATFLPRLAGRQKALRSAHGPAASLTNYNYSPALRRPGLTWTEARLDRWLSGPTRLVPGTRMGLSVAIPADRRDIIAYLRTEGAAAR